MKLPSITLLASLLAALASTAADPLPLEPRDFAHLSSDLPADEAVLFGTLDNGMRYAILPNTEPPGNISLRLVVESGSLQESEEQQGLAHYVEHMAFNGTVNYPAGEMVEYFQRLGMAFGADTNAYVSFDETVYMLELPSADPEVLRDSLLLLQDYAAGMLMSTEEVDKERGVILSEKRFRDTPDFRSWQARFSTLFPGSRLEERWPIGIESTITAADRQTLLDYYETWYRPERMAVIAVGEVDKSLVPLLEEYFGGIEAKRPKPEVELPGPLNLPQSFEAKLHTEPELGFTAVELYAIQSSPPKPEPDTLESRLKDIRSGLVNSALTQRLQKLSKEEDAPFLEGDASSSDWFQIARISSVDLTTQADNWEAALTLAEQELRRMLKYGVTKSELAEAKANQINQLEQAAAEAPTRLSRALAGSLAASVSDAYVFTHPETDLELFAPAIEAITIEEAMAQFRADWGYRADQADSGTLPAYRLLVLGTLELEDPTALKQTFSKSYAEAVEPPVETEIPPFEYQDFGTPGVIAVKEMIEDLEIRSYTFENGVTLLTKQTDFEAGVIHINARFGGGDASEPTGLPGLSQLASWTFAQGGLEAHSLEELQRIFAGKTVGGNFIVDEDAFIMSGSTRPQDLRDQLNLMAAYLIAPGYRPEARRQAAKLAEAVYPRLDSDPMGVLQDEVDEVFAGGDSRFGFPEYEDLKVRTLEEVEAWLSPALEKAALEIAVVGDFDEDAVVEAVAATFGALPARAESWEQDWAQVQFPADLHSKTFEYETQMPRSIALAAWGTTGREDIHTVRRLSVLGRIFGDHLRVRIREDLGATYSPTAYNRSFDAYPQFGYLLGYVEVDPAQAVEVSELLDEIGQAIAANGITEDELDRARTPIIESIARARRSNSYWLGSVLSGASRSPQQLEWARTIEDDFGAISVDEVQALAEKYLGREALKVQILPVSPSDT